MVRIVGKVFFQSLFQRTVITPCQIGKLMFVTQGGYQREKVDTDNGVVGIGLQLLVKAVTEKIVMEFIGEVVIYRLTGMFELLQIEQRILVGIASHIVKQNIHVNLHSKAGRPACINKNIMGHIVENSKEKENPDSI